MTIVNPRSVNKYYICLCSCVCIYALSTYFRSPATPSATTTTATATILCSNENLCYTILSKYFYNFLHICHIPQVLHVPPEATWCWATFHCHNQWMVVAPADACFSWPKGLEAPAYFFVWLSHIPYKDGWTDVLGMVHKSFVFTEMI